jgi:electron transport complex protein RnfE
MTKLENFTKGFFKENPIFVYLLGMCPALAVTSTFETALGMGLMVIFVLALSNLVISLFRNVIKDEIRTPAYIVIIATLVTIVDMVSAAYVPVLSESLGVFIPLIVVNCLILGRAESFASKNNVLDSIIDGVGMALGFTMALVIIGITREFLATGGIMWGDYLPFFVQEPVNLLTLDWILKPLFGSDFTIRDNMFSMFSMPAGAFIGLGFILAVIQSKKVKKEKAAEALMKQKVAEAKAKKAARLKEQAAKEALNKKGATA